MLRNALPDAPATLRKRSHYHRTSLTLTPYNGSRLLDVPGLKTDDWQHREIWGVPKEKERRRQSAIIVTFCQLWQDHSTR